MPTFHYIALDQNGQEVAGQLDASNESECINQLRQSQLYPTQVAQEGKGDEAIRAKTTAPPSTKGTGTVTLGAIRTFAGVFFLGSLLIIGIIVWLTDGKQSIPQTPRQVVVNLQPKDEIIYTPAGKRVVTLIPLDTYFYIEVEDRPPGVPPKRRQYIPLGVTREGFTIQEQ